MIVALGIMVVLWIVFTPTRPKPVEIKEPVPEDFSVPWPPGWER